jgi:PAS domain S-box-containing protein
VSHYAARWVLTVALIVLGITTAYLKSSADRGVDRAFATRCADIHDAIVVRLDDHARVLVDCAALFEASDAVSRREWKVFTQSQKIERDLPGTQGVGFSLLIPRAELDRHLQEIRAEGFPDYTVRPAGNRETYTSIIYLEPFADRNLRAFGYDMMSEPVRRAAMEQARDTDAPTLSGKVVLVQETEKAKQAGALMYVPVYRKGMPIDSVEQRRAAIVGWVYSPYRMDDLLQGILGARNLKMDDGLHLQVFDGDRTAPERLLFESPTRQGNRRPLAVRLSRQLPVDSSGHRWTLAFSQDGAGLFSAAYSTMWLNLTGGAVIALLLYWLVRNLQNAHAEARRLAAGLTADLRSSEQSYRDQFVNNSSVMLLIDPADGTIVDANDAARRFYGHTREQLLAMRITEINTLPAAVVREAMARTTEVSNLRFEFRHRLADGSLRDVEVASSRIRFGGRVLLHSIVQDITERTQAVAALASEKERLAVTLRSIVDGVITTDLQGRLVTMNRAAEMLTGWAAGEAAGKPVTTVFRVIDEASRLECADTVARILAGEEAVEPDSHHLLVSRDGTERVVTEAGAPLMDRAGGVGGVVLVIRDMTERQKLIDALQRTDKLDSLGILAGGIAHDFNNILAGVFGYIELAREITTDPTVYAYLDKSMTAFGRAKGLTGQLLTFAKGGAPQRKQSEMGPLVRENASFALSGSEFACDYDIAEDLRLVDCDKLQIGQVIDNLVINARQSMAAGGSLVISLKNVRVEDGEHPSLKEGMYVRLSVADTGTGVPTDLLKRIFDPFFTTKQKGYGLGLATCYAIVQKHDGCIEVDSVVGEGSTFHVFLPASKMGVVADAPWAPVAHRGSGTMLIMDDEASIREVLGTALRGMGYAIVEARDGEEALRLCAEAASSGTPVGGAFFDLTIPGGMGGKVAVVQLRKQFPNMPVYASSGYSDDPVMSRPTEFGFTDSIHKPYLKDELAAMLNRH